MNTKTIEKMFVGLMMLAGTTGGTAFAQTTRVHPDLNVPEIDFSQLKSSEEKIRNALAALRFQAEPSVEGMQVAVPDYRLARQKLIEKMMNLLKGHVSVLEKIESEAVIGQQQIIGLQAEYSSRLYSLEQAASRYPDSRDTFLQSYRLEKERMKSELSQQFISLMSKLQKEYMQSLGLVFENSNAREMSQKKPNAFVEVLSVVGATVMVPASFVMWMAPIPLIFSFNTFFDEDNMPILFGLTSFEGERRSSYFGVLEKAHQKISASQMRKKIMKTAQSLSGPLFADCQTSACVFELEKDYRDFFTQIAKLNSSLQVGSAVLNENPEKIKLSWIFNVLKKTAGIAAKSKRQVAVFLR